MVMAMDQFATIVASSILAVFGVRTIHGLCLESRKHISGMIYDAMICLDLPSLTCVVIRIKDYEEIIGIPILCARDARLLCSVELFGSISNPSYAWRSTIEMYAIENPQGELLHLLPAREVLDAAV
jgi:hypothetical protein